MALSIKLAMRQSQAMVLTPQLLQAIKLLQMPNLELTQFIENELASNPLLERAEEREEVSLQQADPEAYVGEAVSLRDHLERQAAILLPDPAERMIGAALIDALDEAGYVVGSIEEIAERLRADGHPVERVLLRLQTLEPTGVFARSLAECLALQLKERDRFDPAMQAFIENLPALARRDFAVLRRACGVDDEDLRDMLAEIRRLEPKPGRAFGDPPAAPAIPDVHVTVARDFGWRVELNTRALPRVLVNEVYAAEI